MACIKIAEQAQQTFNRRVNIAAQIAGSTKMVQLASVSIGTVTEVKSAFRSMGKTSVGLKLSLSTLP